MKKVVIVGAGVCGLTLGYHFARAGLPVVVLEKEAVVGGLARGFTYGDFKFDVGPHRFYSPIPEVMGFIEGVLGEEAEKIGRVSAVYFAKQYHLWPLRLRTVFQLPPLISAMAAIDILRKERSQGDLSFESYILGKYGRTLFNTFFKDYTEKFLGIPASATHEDWAKIGVERATIDEKVDTASLSSLVKLMLIPKPREMEFAYPRGGVHLYSDRLQRRIEEMGGEVQLNTSPTGIEVGETGVTHVVTPRGTHEVLQMVWTGPLNELACHLHLPDPGLRYLALMLYNITLRRPVVQPYQWTYYGAKDISFSRISCPDQFSPSMAPEGRGGLCVEVPAAVGDEKWIDPERLIPTLKRDLKRVHVIRHEDDIDQVHIEQIPYAYPIYDINYREKLTAVKSQVSRFKNLTLAGRTGTFWYNNMDHSIEQAMKLSRIILGRVKDVAPDAEMVMKELTWKSPGTNGKVMVPH